MRIRTLLVAGAVALAPALRGQGDDGSTPRLRSLGSGRAMSGIGSERAFGRIGSDRDLSDLGADRDLGDLGSGRPFGGPPPLPPPARTPDNRPPVYRWSGYGRWPYDPWRDSWYDRPGRDALRDRLIRDSLRAPEPGTVTEWDSTAVPRRRLGPVSDLRVAPPAADLGARLAAVLVEEADRALAAGRYDHARELLAALEPDPAAPARVLLPRALALLGLGREAEAVAVCARLAELDPQWRDSPWTEGPLWLPVAEAQALLARLAEAR